MSSEHETDALWTIDEVLGRIAETEGTFFEDAATFLLSILHERDAAHSMQLLTYERPGELRTLEKHERSSVMNTLRRHQGSRDLLKHVEYLARFSFRASDIAPLLHLHGYLVDRPHPECYKSFDSLFDIMRLHRNTALHARVEAESASKSLEDLQRQVAYLKSENDKLSKEEKRLRDEVSALRKATEDGERHKLLADRLRRHRLQEEQQEEHYSEKLRLLIRASNEFWKTADRRDRATQSVNATVSKWIKEQGRDLFSASLADSGASIIRPEWAESGRPPAKP